MIEATQVIQPGVINPFTDVPYAPSPISNPVQGGAITDITELQAGFGDSVFRADRQGIWLGGKNFATSPIRIDMDGRLIMRDTSTNRILIDGRNGYMKVSRVGYDVLTTADVNLVFHSSYSMFREMHMQTNAEQRFTDQATYQAYNDCQVRVNFDDWAEADIYFEVVSKTGAGVGYMQLLDLATSVGYGEVQVTSTTAVSGRSPAGGVLSGVHNFREEQKVTGGGGAFTDVYIGRLIFRYDF